MRVNGEDIILKEACFLKDFLEHEGYIAERIAVELNGEIVPKTAYATKLLDNDSRIEIVAFVGGG